MAAALNRRSFVAGLLSLPLLRYVRPQEPLEDLGPWREVAPQCDVHSPEASEAVRKALLRPRGFVDLGGIVQEPGAWDAAPDGRTLRVACPDCGQERAAVILDSARALPSGECRMAMCGCARTMAVESLDGSGFKRIRATRGKLSPAP